MSEWISVFDYLPAQEAVVDISCKWPRTEKRTRMTDVTYLSDHIGPYWHGSLGHVDDSVITHWMMPPEDPEESR